MAEFIEAASQEEVPPGTSTTVTVAGKQLALFNVNGTVYATDDKCLHAGGSLGWGGKLEGKVVTCRLHGWKYDVTTGNMPLAPGMSSGVIRSRSWMAKSKSRSHDCRATKS